MAVVNGGLAGFFCLALLFVLEPALSQERARDVERLREQVAAAEGRLEALGSQEHGLLEDYRRSRLEKELIDRRLELIGAQTAELDRRIASSELQLEFFTDAADRHERSLIRQARVLQSLGGLGYLRLLLSAERASDPRRAIREVRFLSRRDSALVEQLELSFAEAERERLELEEERRERSALLAEASKERETLSRTMRRLDQSLAQIRQSQDTLLEDIQGLRSQESRVTQLIELSAATTSDPGKGPEIQAVKGALDWPVEGRVAVPFGPRRDPRYKTTVPHNGLELALPEPGPVRVIFPGRVVYADEFSGFGYTVVVSHRGDVLTLYARLDDLLVGKGDVLLLGDEVGLAGASIYFELRIGTEPEDPSAWLR